jgi:cobalamin biosynthesis protein CbiG
LRAGPAGSYCGEIRVCWPLIRHAAFTGKDSHRFTASATLMKLSRRKFLHAAAGGAVVPAIAPLASASPHARFTAERRRDARLDRGAEFLGGLSMTDKLQYDG